MERSKHVVCAASIKEWSTPEACWNTLVLKRRDHAIVLQARLVSGALSLASNSGEECFVVSFKRSGLRAKTSGSHDFDRAIVRPVVDPGPFTMQGEMFDLQTFENADALVEHLFRCGLRTPFKLGEAASGRQPRPVSPRSVQRHFRATLG